MVSTLQVRSQSFGITVSNPIRESKILHKSPYLHPLARFVTEETAALLFKIKPEQIERIECWRYVVYVYGKGVSRFVSYADFPPIVATLAPTGRDCLRWHKRWKCKQAPDFWQIFYIHQFDRALSVPTLIEWGKLVGMLKFAFSEVGLQRLREAFVERKICLEF